MSSAENASHTEGDAVSGAQMEAYIRRFGWKRISHRPGKWERSVISTSGSCAPHSLSEAYEWQRNAGGRS